ncbi:hypothetical protein AB4428_06945 [Vibrio lentus]
MGTSWVPDIYHDGTKKLWMRSQDSKHNGTVGCNGSNCNLFNLDDDDWHSLEPGYYQTSWFGIPWYYESEDTHYKIFCFSEDKPEKKSLNGVRVYTSSLNGQDAIHYVNESGETLATTPVSNGSDTNCKMVITEDNGFYIEAVNSGNADAITVLNDAGQLVSGTIQDVAAITGIFLPVE